MNFKSDTFCKYYGTNPLEYDTKFMHFNIDISDESENEYNLIKEDLNNLYQYDSEAFLLYFSDVANYIKITSHIDINNIYNDKIYLRIRSEDDYQTLLKYNKLDNIKIIIDINDLERLNITDLNLVIQIDKVNELPESKLNELSNKYQIKEVLVGQTAYLSKDYEFLYDDMAEMYHIDASNKLMLEKINKITNDIYKVEDYLKILHRLNDIINELNIENEIDGFYKIFDYITKNVIFDDNGIGTTIISNQNLIGPVLYGKSVCEGYAKYLQQILSLINIDSIIVFGGGNKEDDGHMWNQVCIDGKWYNADVTASSYGLQHNLDSNTCLVSDDTMIYKVNSCIYHVCNENYENNIIKK